MQFVRFSKCILRNSKKITSIIAAITFAPSAPPMTLYYFLHLLNLQLPNKWSVEDIPTAAGILYVADIPTFLFLSLFETPLFMFVCIGAVANFPIWFVAMIGTFSAASRVENTPLNPQYALLPIMAIFGGLSGWIYFKLAKRA